LPDCQRLVDYFLFYKHTTGLVLVALPIISFNRHTAGVFSFIIIM